MKDLALPTMQTDHKPAIPDPTEDPLGYLRLISRDLRAGGNTVAANGVLDAIIAIQRKEAETIARVREEYEGDKRY